MLSRDRDRCVTLGELTLTESDTLHRFCVTLRHWHVCCSWQGIIQMGVFIFDSVSKLYLKEDILPLRILTHNWQPVWGELKVQEGVVTGQVPRVTRITKVSRSPLSDGKLGPVPGRGHICRPNFLPLIDLSWQLADKLKQSTSYI